MKKTIREWLETLPEPYRSEALENHTNIPIKDEFYANSLDEAILKAFVWKSSKQDNSYWLEVYNKKYNVKETIINKAVLKTARKSNREIAEEIWNELSVHGNDGEGYTLTIESILDKYL